MRKIDIRVAEKCENCMLQAIIKLHELQNNQSVQREKLKNSKRLVIVKFCKNSPRLFNYRLFKTEIELN